VLHSLPVHRKILKLNDKPDVVTIHHRGDGEAGSPNHIRFPVLSWVRQLSHLLDLPILSRLLPPFFGVVQQNVALRPICCAALLPPRIPASAMKREPRSVPAFREKKPRAKTRSPQCQWIDPLRMKYEGAKRDPIGYHYAARDERRCKPHNSGDPRETRQGCPDYE